MSKFQPMTIKSVRLKDTIMINGTEEKFLAKLHEPTMATHGVFVQNTKGTSYALFVPFENIIYIAFDAEPALAT